MNEFKTSIENIINQFNDDVKVSFGLKEIQFHNFAGYTDLYLRRFYLQKKYLIDAYCLEGYTKTFHQRVNPDYHKIALNDKHPEEYELLKLFWEKISPSCVHTGHCCMKHGCKYGNENCPVENKKKHQDYPCEYCHE